MTKPKILFLMDMPNWAYDQIANYVISSLSDKYDFYKDYELQPPITWKEKVNYARFTVQKAMHRRVSNEKYDLAVYLWWKSRLLMPDVRAEKTVTGIFTEGFPPGFSEELGNISPASFIENIVKPSSGIIAGNKNIYKFYSSYDLPVFYATGAADTSIFSYKEIKRKDDEFRVCWTGNPNRKFKGYADYVIPAVELAQKFRPNIKMVTRFSGPLKTLPDFYRSVDVMVNASIGDAGPGFIIDAGGCGVPSISTDVGYASELIDDNRNGVLVARNVEEMAQKIIKLYDDREMLKSMSRSIASDVKKEWGYESRAKYWDSMFISVLSEE
ncbi:MAG: glycosyltransferase family 4 protein [Gammaproteobacteria bacterium]|nr:glycosyltransferase family 4 protein [Gammaproteobacteria bacterium]